MADDHGISLMDNSDFDVFCSFALTSYPVQKHNENVDYRPNGEQWRFYVGSGGAIVPQFWLCTPNLAGCSNYCPCE